MHRSPAVATLHAAVTLLAALTISVIAKRSSTVLAAAAYVVGSEVIWRMCGAYIFHETAKYALCVLFVIALVRMRRAKVPRQPVLYFALLIPGIVVPYFLFSLDYFRRSVMFDLSGPLALAVAVCFCANVKLRAGEIWRIFPALACPLVGVAAITIFTTYTREETRFTTNSNFETSGGFGPNQVCSSLAFGALVAVLYLIHRRTSMLRRGLVAVTALMLLVQSTMTFSRSGLISVALTVLIVSPILMQTRRARLMFIGALVGVVLSVAIIYPILDNYTGGKLTARYEKVNVSHRDTLVLQDLQIWLNNPFFGVGVGISKFGHLGFMASHTEFSRSVAEHGMLGLTAVLLLFWMAFKRAMTLRRDSLAIRPFLFAMLVWALLYLAVNGMRTAAPAFAFGLAFVSLRATVRPPRAEVPVNAEALSLAHR